MEIAYRPEGVPEKKNSKSISWLAQAGFQNIVLDMRQYCSAWELEHKEEMEKTAKVYPEETFVSLRPDCLVEKGARLIEQCKELGIKNTIGIAPALPWDTKRKDLDGLVKEVTKQCILTCKNAGCKDIVINPLVKDPETEEEWGQNIRFYGSFAEESSKAGLCILVSNAYRNYNGHLIRGRFSDAYELKRFVDELNARYRKGQYGLCIDVGVCNLVGQDVYEFLVLLKDQVKAVIIRENNGTTDDRLLPFSMSDKSGIQKKWTGIIRALRAIDFDGQLIFDFRDTIRAHSHLLRADLDIFVKKTVDYLVWQISMEHVMKKYPSRVLFGAGNMCRNYMKCYGEQYPPLFTCDNNPDLWGSDFCGLLVKAPESLKELPEECAVFICNVYYREIEEQLLSMGIKNKIEFFSDEFMPSFYFDRLESRR